MDRRGACGRMFQGSAAGPTQTNSTTSRQLRAMTTPLPDVSPSQATIVDAYATWVSNHVADVVSHFAASPANPQNVTSPDGDVVLRIGPILGSSPDSTLMTNVHLAYEAGDAPAELFWHLHISRQPSGSPPDSIVKENVRLGGWDGLVHQIKRTQHPKPARYRVIFDIDASNWACRMLPRPVPSAMDDACMLGLGPDWQVEQIGYRQPAADLGITELAIVFLHDPNVFRVTVHANGGLELGANMTLPYINNSIRSVMRYCFQAITKEP